MIRRIMGKLFSWMGAPKAGQETKLTRPDPRPDPIPFPTPPSQVDIVDTPSLEGGENVLNYSHFDMFGLFEPDPPWVLLPKQNDDFLQKHFIPIQFNHLCHFCKEKMGVHNLGDRRWPAGIREFMKSDPNFNQVRTMATLYLCQICGWWLVYQNDMYPDRLISVCWAKIKQLDVAGLQTALDHLKDRLSKKDNPLVRLSDSALTPFIQECFNDHFRCDVTRVGTDMVADFYFINAENPGLLQVNQAGDIQLVSEVFGVEMSGGQPKSLWISAEPRFSGETGVQILQQEGFPIKITNYDALRPLLGRIGENAPTVPWEKIWRADSIKAAV